MSDATLVFDDDCGFCTWWARRLARHADVRLVGFSDIGHELRERLPDEYEECAHLVVDDQVYSCGESIEEAFVRSEVGSELRPAVDFLREFEEYSNLREMGYRFVADNRGLFGSVLSADPPARSTEE